MESAIDILSIISSIYIIFTYRKIGDLTKDDFTIDQDRQKIAKGKMSKNVEDKEAFEEDLMEIAAPIEDNKALTSLEIKKGYYPFGINEVFSIDVTRCFPAPSNYVYRRLNQDWVRILTLDFIQEPKQEEILAILMPFDSSTKFSLDKLAKEDVHNVDYWIISGQHSISAAKRLQAAKVAKVAPLNCVSSSNLDDQRLFSIAHQRSLVKSPKMRIYLLQCQCRRSPLLTN